MDELIEKLKAFMGERDLTLKDIGILVDRTPTCIWRFLHHKTKPNDQTLYKIRKLIGD